MALAWLALFAWTKVDAQTVFPDTTRQIILYWAHDNPSREPILFRVYGTKAAEPLATRSLMDTVSRDLLGEQNLTWVTATDEAGNESDSSNHCRFSFAGGPEPPQTPDGFPCYLDTTALFWGQRIGPGNVVFNCRDSWKHGGGVVFWSGPNPSESSAILQFIRPLNRAATLHVEVYGRMVWYDNPATIRVSLNNVELAKPMISTDRLAWYDMGEAYTEPGNVTIQIRAIHSSFIVYALKISVVGEDNVSPNAPSGHGVRLP